MKRIVNFNIKNLCFFVHHFIQIVKNLGPLLKDISIQKQKIIKYIKRD